MKRSTIRLPRGAQRAFITADDYRELIQRYIDRARADHTAAKRLAEEARQRFDTNTDPSGEGE